MDERQREGRTGGLGRGVHPAGKIAEAQQPQAGHEGEESGADQGERAEQCENEIHESDRERSPRGR